MHKRELHRHKDTDWTNKQTDRYIGRQKADTHAHIQYIS